jgi:aminoglycoside phosphotransferase family enzyme/gluconate kinase
MSTTESPQALLVRSLMNPSCYDHPVVQVDLVETHISWVLLTGNFVYKIKKPVDFGFLDFSTLEKRKFYCEEELRLNRRLADDLYLAVVPIGGTPNKPELNATRDAIEYAVKMKQFPQAQQLDEILARGELKPDQLDAVARLIAQFHLRIRTVADDEAYGDPEHVYQPVSENFRQIRQHLSVANLPDELSYLEHWSAQCFERIKAVIASRKSDGFVRECHGDLHLTNLAWYRDVPLVFDCIEFNPNLYWIDVMNDIAFLVMDLQDRGQWSLAYRLLDIYLQVTGDYAGIAVLRFYLVYRAMVLAKVNAIRLGQTADDTESWQRVKNEYLNYIQLGTRYIRHIQPLLVITRGLSGSGKSTVAGQLLEHLGAIRIRSDVERKRIFGIARGASAAAENNSGIYTPGATQRTYDRLYDLADQVIDAGYPVIVDAAFLQHAQRMPFQQLAMQKQVPYIILSLQADTQVLRQLLQERRGDASDAGLSVLEQQLVSQELPMGDEQPHLISIDTASAVDVELLVEEIRQRAGIDQKVRDSSC